MEMRQIYFLFYKDVFIAQHSYEGATISESTERSNNNNAIMFIGFFDENYPR